jgi:two-component system chemotaxis sensor kinase CheA
MMLEQFKKKYLEEVNDLLNDMEGSLLQLEQNPSSEDEINQVFRVMHTIKGTSGMYEFKTVEKITHDVESIYGKIRDNHISVSKEVSAITLECIDLLRQLLNAPGPDDDKLVEQFLAKLNTISPDGNSKPQEQPTMMAPDTDGAATYYVLFTPEADITTRGINIQSLLAEIDAIGDGLTIPRSWSDDDPNATGKFYMYWESVFSTTKPYNEIEEIFLFVADEVKITKIAEKDLFQKEEFVAEITRLQSTDTKTDVTQLAKFANSLFGNSTSGSNLQTEKNQPNIQPEQPTKQEEPAKPEQPKTAEHSLAAMAKINNSYSDEKTYSRSTDTSDNKNSSIKVDSDKLDELMNLVSELVTTKAEMLLLAEKYNIPELGTICEKIDKLSNKFKDNALSIRLVPIESMVLRFQRLVRDLSNELGKKIDFVTEGTDTELDKTIIDNLSVPLMHIIRNSIDHGIESVERRRELHKPDHGIIKFTAFYSGSNVFIQVQDDGAGMNPEYLKKKAIEKGFLKPTEKPTDRQLYDLVFLPGFSTAQKITGISGRGVGMDVVKQNIIKLRGEIEMDSEVDLGTITTIKLPLTLSIVDALLVSVESTLLLIPVYIIDSCSQITRQKLEEDNGRFIYEGEPTTIIDLRKEMEIHGTPPEEESVIIVNYKDGRVGLIVDKIVGEHQAVLKSLGRYFANQEYISGGSILGDGSIALVLDTNKLIRQMEKAN